MKKVVHGVPTSNNRADYYFKILGKSIALSNQLECNFIEFAKIFLTYNKIKDNINDYYLPDYDTALSVLEESKELFLRHKGSKQEKTWCSFIDIVRKENFFDDDFLEIFDDARKSRNAVAHKYPATFMESCNNFEELERLKTELRVDIEKIINAKAMVDFCFRLMIGAESELKPNMNGGTNLADFVERTMQWVFSDVSLNNRK